SIALSRASRSASSECTARYSRAAIAASAAIKPQAIARSALERGFFGELATAGLSLPGLAAASDRSDGPGTGAGWGESFTRVLQRRTIGVGTRLQRDNSEINTNLTLDIYTAHQCNQREQFVEAHI